MCRPPTQSIVRTNPATGIYHAQLVVLIDLTLHPPVQFRSIASIVVAPSFFAHVPPRFLTDFGNPQRPCQRRPHSSLVYPYHAQARILDWSILSLHSNTRFHRASFRSLNPRTCLAPRTTASSHYTLTCSFAPSLCQKQLSCYDTPTLINRVLTS